MSFSGKQNKWINNHASSSGELHDENGNYYYISHPPFAYYLPYAVFCLLQQEPSVSGLKIMHLLLHFLSGLFIYFIVNLLSIRRARSQIFIPSYVAYAVYIFMPVTLWFQSNVYMSDMLVHTLFIINIYTTLKFIIRERFFNAKYIFFYSLCLFLMCFTSWLGYFFAATVLVYAIWKLQYIKGFYMLIILSVLMPALALGITLFTYSGPAGIDAVYHEYLARFAVRGTHTSGNSIWSKLYSILSGIYQVIKNYGIHYILVYIWLAFTGTFVATRGKMKFLFTRNGYRFLYLSIVCVIALHLVFLEYSHHDFSVLYASAFFSVLIGILYDKLALSNRTNTVILRASIVFLIMGNIFLFYLMNWPGKTNLTGKPYNYAVKFGEAIQSIQKNQSLAMASYYKPDASEIWYAKQNILHLKDDSYFSLEPDKNNNKPFLLFDYNAETCTAIIKDTIFLNNIP